MVAVTDYATTVAAYLTVLKNNKSTLGVAEANIFEAGSTIDFNIPAPFIYLHSDIGTSKVHNGFVSELVLEFFIGAEGKTSSASAKAAAFVIASKLLKVLLDNMPVQVPEDFIEFFSEFSNKAIIKLTVTDIINVYYQTP